jgi:hypothetical protein
MDAYIRSQYFYKDRVGKITAGPVWDRDLTFGVGGYFGNDQVSGWQYQQVRRPVANDWFTILLTDPAFVTQLKARWRELRQGVLSDAQLNARITALATPLTNAAARNFARWPNLTTPLIGPFVTPTASTWAGQVTYLRDWMTRRVAWLDSSAGWDRAGGATPTPTPSTACSATFAVTNSWNNGFVGTVRVSAGSTAITRWTVRLTLPSGTAITSLWNGQQTGTSVSNLSWNGALAAGASTEFGFQGTGSATGLTVAGCS